MPCAPRISVQLCDSQLIPVTDAVFRMRVALLRTAGVKIAFDLLLKAYDCKVIMDSLDLRFGPPMLPEL
jgi:hypothetical protein